MAKEEKIFLKPDDDIEDVIEKIKSSRATKVILNIPEGSVLKSSLDNFHTLKRESLQVDKDLLIESVDPHIEELADLSKIDSLNPVFGKKEKIVADIIPRSKLQGTSATKEQKIKNNDFFSGDFKKRKPKKKKSWFSKLFKSSKKKKSKSKSKPKKTKGDWINLKWLTKRWVSISVTLLILGSLYFVGFYLLPQADISINLNDQKVSIDEKVQVNTSISTTSFDNNESFTLSVPGEIITSKKNTQMKFDASEERDVERKAKGDIWIYNEYGDESITLVENTRFKTPDGKIYKTDKAITVPPADTSGDVIEPSKIKASVTAAEPGKEYNIQPSSEEKWTIPGFQEAGLTEMYNGFYANPDGDMTGGLIGYAKDPTQEDIENAKQSVRNTLRGLLKSEVLITGASDFRVLDEASEFEILDEDVNREVDDDGKFSVFAQAQSRNFVFKGELLKDSLLEIASNFDYPINVIEENLNYKNINIDWDKGEMTFDVEGSIIVKPRINTEEFTANVLGKGKSEIKPIFNDIPNLKNAKVSLWPFWVTEVPMKESKVNITIK